MNVRLDESVRVLLPNGAIAIINQKFLPLPSLRLLEVDIINRAWPTSKGARDLALISLSRYRINFLHPNGKSLAKNINNEWRARAHCEMSPIHLHYWRVAVDSALHFQPTVRGTKADSRWLTPLFWSCLMSNFSNTINVNELLSSASIKIENFSSKS